MLDKESQGGERAPKSVPTTVRIKACGITTKDELRDAIQIGASVVGLITEMNTIGSIPDGRIDALLRVVPSDVDSFLLLQEDKAEAIVRHYRKVPATAIQLVRSVSEQDLVQVRSELPGVMLVQVIYVDDDEAVHRAKAVEEYVDAIHLDSPHGHPTGPELGGTGHTHDWSISRRVRDAVKVPVMLAGGLNAQNVGEAIEVVQPWGVDVCHGVRDEEDHLDRNRLRAFVEAARSIPTQPPRGLRSPRGWTS